MPLTCDEFTQQLSASGLLDAASVAECLSNLSADKQPQDGEKLARELVKQKRLTKFQAEQLYAGKGKSLTLGNYVILDKLGQGGMGVVLKAEHKRMKRLVALKVMNPKAVKDPESLKRFHREVEVAAKLWHPNIVAADDGEALQRGVRRQSGQRAEWRSRLEDGEGELADRGGGRFGVFRDDDLVDGGSGDRSAHRANIERRTIRAAAAGRSDGEVSGQHEEVTDDDFRFDGGDRSDESMNHPTECPKSVVTTQTSCRLNASCRARTRR